MANKKTTIIIPALNEENNLSFIVKSLLRQTYKDFNLIIINDNSTDKTQEIAEYFAKNNNFISVTKNTERLGKLISVTEEYKKIDSDIVIIIDADTQIKDDDFIEKIIDAFKYHNIELYCANAVPLPPKSFIQKIFYREELFWNDVKNIMGEKAMRFRIDGKSYACGKKLYKNLINSPHSIIEEDHFAFYKTKENNFNVMWKEDAKIYFELPNSIMEHIKQTIRYRTVTVSPYIRAEILKQYPKMSFNAKFKSGIKHLTKSPIETLGFLLIYFMSLIFSIFFRAKPKWVLAKSTKKIS